MSRYQDYSRVPGEQFVLRVQSAEVRGLFGGKGTVTGTLLSGSVYRDDLLTVRGKKTKPYQITGVRLEGNEVRPRTGAKVQLEIKGIGKKDLTSGDILCGDPYGKHATLTDIYEYTVQNVYYHGVDQDYFAEVFARYFPDYDIRRNETIRGAKGEAIPVDFLFYKSGSPYLAIFLRDTIEWNKKEAAYLQSVCDGQGILRLNFIVNFQNKVEYVCDRVDKALG